MNPKLKKYRRNHTQKNFKKTKISPVIGRKKRFITFKVRVRQMLSQEKAKIKYNNNAVSSIH